MSNNRVNSGKPSGNGARSLEAILSEARGVMLLDFGNISTSITPWNVQRLSRKGVGAKRSRSARGPSVFSAAAPKQGSGYTVFVHGATARNGERQKTGECGSPLCIRTGALSAGRGLLSIRAGGSVHGVIPLSIQRITRNISMPWRGRDTVGTGIVCRKSCTNDTFRTKSSDRGSSSVASRTSTKETGYLFWRQPNMLALSAATTKFERTYKFTIETRTGETMKSPILSSSVLRAILRYIADRDIVRSSRRLEEIMWKRHDRNTNVNVFEHNPKLNGSYRNQFTCLADSNDIIPCCEKLGNKSRYLCGYFTIVDLTENVDAKGNKYQYEVKLLPTKLKTLQLLRRKKSERGSLIGCMFGVHRDTADDANCGNEFEFKREVDLDKLFKLVNYKGKKLSELFKEANEKPEVMQRVKDTFQVSLDEAGHIIPKIYSFNYLSLLAPRDPKEIRQMLGSVGVGDEGGEGQGADKATDDNIPF